MIRGKLQLKLEKKNFVRFVYGLVMVQVSVIKMIRGGEIYARD